MDQAQGIVIGHLVIGGCRANMAEGRIDQVNDCGAPQDLTNSDDALLRLSRDFRWISQIEAPDAPGFFFYGAEVQAAAFGHPLDSIPAASLSGKGFDRKTAFMACAGESAEHLSRLEWGDEELTDGLAEDVPHGLAAPDCEALLHLLGPDDGPPQSWMSGTRLSDGSRILVPTNLCLRRREVTPPSAISTGCAAGPTRDAATLSALLELVERDAAALWWQGGNPGRPLSLETLARADAASLVARLRGETDNRAAWLLDITSDLGIPVFAAISFDKTGRGFASGLAARLDPAAAIRDALLELCQIELGHHIVAAKQKVRGEDALNDADRRKLLRSREIDAQRCAWLHPAGPPQDHPDAGAADPAAGIDHIVGCMRAIGVEPLAVDLTRAAIGVPVMRALAPGLQPFPSTITTSRLAATISRNHIRKDERRIPLF